MISQWQLQDCKTAKVAFRADILVYYWCKPGAKIAFCLIGGSVQREAEIACFPVEKYKLDTLIAKIQYPQGDSNSEKKIAEKRGKTGVFFRGWVYQWCNSFRFETVNTKKNHENPTKIHEEKPRKKISDFPAK